MDKNNDKLISLEGKYPFYLLIYLVFFCFHFKKIFLEFIEGVEVDHSNNPSLSHIRSYLNCN